jgi:predicted enzyme related to lactoylglutathione lyase
MPVMTKYDHGQFSWVDLSSHDMAEAKRFYGEVFGWSVEDQDTGGGPPYAIFTNDGNQVAGLGQMSDEMKAQGIPPHWSNYINVDDAEAVTKKATSLGANLMFPVMQVVEAGWMSMIVDPTGAPFAIWQKNQHIGAGQVNDPGCFCWNELATRDVEGAKTFYGELFGWTFEENRDGEAPYWIVRNQGRMNGGMMGIAKDWGDVPPHWGVYFTVEDADATAANIQKMGGKVVMAPFDVSIGRIGINADPQGGHFNIFQGETD